VRKGVENPHASCTPPASPLPLFTSTFGAQGDKASAACDPTPSKKLRVFTFGSFCFQDQGWGLAYDVAGDCAAEEQGLACDAAGDCAAEEQGLACDVAGDCAAEEQGLAYDVAGDCAAEEQGLAYDVAGEASAGHDLDFLMSTYNPPMSAAAASAASCASTPPTAAYPGLLEKRGARNMTAKPRPTKRAKTEQQFETPPSTPLRRVTEFGQDHVNEVFGFEVKERPVHKMRELLRVFHSMAAHNTAQFEVQGEANVFGFTNVHVLDRASWDEEMLALGTSLSRAPKAGRELKEPKSCIYEILMCYCGMQVVRSNGASSRNKSLMQDSYTFNAEHFARTKANVNNCRSRKSSQKK